MFRNIHFSNNGVISLIDFTTMGDSSKRDDALKIGKFDSGLKYAIAILVRNNIRFDVISGDYEYTFNTVVKEDVQTSKIKEVIQLNQRNLITNEDLVFETAFAVNLGYEWELWMALRELYSNCIDEGGIVSFDKPNPKETLVTIFGCEEIENIINRWSDYFLDPQSTPIYDTGAVKIFKNPTDHVKLYKQGILVHEDVGTLAKYVYDYSLASIDEMRMLNDFNDYESEVRGAINGTNSKDLILDLIENEVYKFENKIGLGNYLSDTWVNVINDYYANHGRFETYKGLMEGFMSDVRFDVGTRSIATEKVNWFSERVNVTPVVEVERVLTFEEQVKKVCADNGFTVKYPIVLSGIERISCVGDVFKKTIYVSESWNAENVWEIVKAQYKIEFNNNSDQIYKDFAKKLKK